ncbi:surfactin synthase thioesterase subunit [Pantoea sp. PA1]|jgi:medium-chain acyl-[acyl-carrier-protein] hydrolase|uniref:thioesterase II family protein n=1 Tax=Pantoea ananas TaxID=553 RepID=UPI000D6D8BC6|nr:thioesterase domain-containing protein [Pantoea ananatis]PWK09840.1 medium-chain acyl-[acyl-carrier-protein] hydrolase [Pantoea ananatis]
MKNEWIVKKNTKDKRLRLFCFSHAGGDASSYLRWQSIMNLDIEVCGVLLPGRGARISEKTISSWPILIKIICDVIDKENDLPFAFFGHSLGGLISFEVAREFQSRGNRSPLHLFVAGCNPPSYKRENRYICRLPDKELIDILRAYDGTPPEALENRELMNLVLPAIRADFSLVDQYKYLPRDPLNLSLTTFFGRDDKHIDPSSIIHWEKEIRKKINFEWFEGGHFFSKKQDRYFIKVIENILKNLI